MVDEEGADWCPENVPELPEYGDEEGHDADDVDDDGDDELPPLVPVQTPTPRAEGSFESWVWRMTRKSRSIKKQELFKNVNHGRKRWRRVQ